MINVIIADQQPIFRAGIAKLLAAEDDIRIVSQPQTFELLLKAVQRLRAQVVLLSSGFPARLSEIAAIRQAAEEEPAILILCTRREEPADFIPFGVRGILNRSVSPEALVKAVRRIAGGCSFYTQLASADPGCEVGLDVVGQRVTSQLSPRELQIIAAVVEGYKNREIAAQLGTTEQIVKNAICTIFDKTGVSDRLELALYVIHHRTLARAAGVQSPSALMGKAAANPAA